MDAMNILQQCDSVCKVAGVDLNVIMLPYRSQLEGKDAGNKTPQLLVSAFCKLGNIRFSEPIDYLSSLKNPASLYLFGDEIHFSAAGHRAMAGYILSQ
jgi:hypothetical protein